jgi:hypothetical protein
MSLEGLYEYNHYGSPKPLCRKKLALAFASGVKSGVLRVRDVQNILNKYSVNRVSDLIDDDVTEAYLDLFNICKAKNCSFYQLFNDENERSDDTMKNYQVTDADIKKAVMGLDPDNSDHWTATCVPMIAAVNEALGVGGNLYTCRKDIERAAPGWNRRKAANAKYNGSSCKEETELVKFQIPFHRMDVNFVSMLVGVFDLTDTEVAELEGPILSSTKSNHSEMANFLCTKAQFGDFIISRNLAGFQNLIQELRADKVEKKKVVSSQEVAEGFNISKKVVEAIIAIVENLGYVRPNDMEWVSNKVIDVSDR